MHHRARRFGVDGLPVIPGQSRPDRGRRSGRRQLLRFFGLHDLTGFGIEDKPLAVAAAAWGLDACRREAGRAPRRLVLAPASGSGGGAAGQDSLDGRPLARCELAWRGPLAFVHLVYRDGRHQRLVWWPDTLPAQRRRELRLAVAARHASRRDRPMAP